MGVSVNKPLTLEQHVEIFRKHYGIMQPFVVSPEIRRALLSVGLDSLGLEFCSENGADGINTNSGGQFLRFKGAADDAATDKTGQSGQEGIVQDASRGPAPRLRGSRGPEDPAREDVGRVEQHQPPRPPDGGVREGVQGDEPLSRGVQDPPRRVRRTSSK